MKLGLVTIKLETTQLEAVKYAVRWRLRQMQLSMEEIRVMTPENKNRYERLSAAADELTAAFCALCT
jgi:hypothetical protein